jgi:putative transposase
LKQAELIIDIQKKSGRTAQGIRREEVTNITKSLAREVGVRPACNALDVSRAGFYRWQHPHGKKPLCHLSPLALSSSERNDVLDILHSERFIDKAP